MSAPRLETAGAVLLAAFAFASGCREGSDASASAPRSRAWPSGVVLAVDDVPIDAEEVDAASAIIHLIEPAASSAQLRRLALAQIVLPRAVARTMAPAARAEALEQAKEKLEALRSGSVAGPQRPDGIVGQQAEGLWTDLGLPVWFAALEAADGEWCGPIEDSGSFVVLRRLWRRDGPVPMATVVAIDALRFDWIDAQGRRARIDQAIDRHRLEIVDPAWREIVPELIQYRMGARQ